MINQNAEVIDGSDADKVDLASLYSRRCRKCNDPFNISSFNQLKAKYLYLEEGKVSCHANYTKVIEIIRGIEKKGNVTCDDIFKIERGMVRLKTLNDVKHDLCHAREKLRTLVGERNYLKYQRDSKSIPEKDDEARDELDYILGELHIQYSMFPSSEKLKAKLLVCCFVISAAIIIPSLIYLGEFADNKTFRMFIIALAAGAFGGFVSVLHKMHDMPLQIDATACFMHLKHGLFSVLLAPVSGSVFAAIAFFLIYSGMISGGIFPHLDVSGTSPPGSGEVTKLIILSFLTGFAERLVPDTLDKMIKRHQIEKARGAERHS